MLLGDLTEKAIHAIVPETIIKAVQEKDGGCGCGKRKQAMNRFSYNLSKALSLTKDELIMSEEAEKTLEELTLSELREKYPNVSARSKEDFIAKIQEELGDIFEQPFIEQENLADYLQSIKTSREKVLFQCESSDIADKIFRELTTSVFPKLDVSVMANSSRRDASLNGSCYVRFTCQTNHQIVSKLSKFTEFKDIV